MRQRDEERALLARCEGERLRAATEPELRTLLDEGTLVVHEAPVVVERGDPAFGELVQREMQALVGLQVQAIESGPKHVAVYLGRDPEGGRVLLTEWVGNAQTSTGDWARKPKLEG